MAASIATKASNTVHRLRAAARGTRLVHVTVWATGTIVSCIPRVLVGSATPVR